MPFWSWLGRVFFGRHSISQKAVRVAKEARRKVRDIRLESGTRPPPIVSKRKRKGNNREQRRHLVEAGLYDANSDRLHH